jgi:lipopolysaccharide transport system permease protein
LSIVPVASSDTTVPSLLASTERRVVVPAKRRVRLADIWRSRRVARVLASRDLKVKYKQSLVGPPWLVLQPLGILGGLVVAFHGVANVNTGGVPYAAFALTGLTVWTCVQTTLLNGVNAFVMNAQLIRRVATPRVAFITGTLLSNLIAPAVILAGAIFTLLVTGQGLPLQALLLPFVAVWVILMTFALLCVFASMSVRFRDVSTLLPFWSQAGLFLSPVGYSLATAPGRTHDVLVLNPLTGLLELTRWSLLGSSMELAPLIVSAVFTIYIVWAGWRTFTRLEMTFADFV